ncbi:hypothetical protein [Rhodococcus qingshengii]|uniref:hypothetical protein n=1 Tax=Rhodococcus qingshengii TaxID=334542 RepID=UPI00294273D3|nr:hypothetical protein [Rhodococcus qingshengii]WOI86008.1 hypothetical protein R0122_22780 [Rhodococcus qingshengii]
MNKLLRNGWGAVLMLLVFAVVARILWALLHPMIPVLIGILVMIVIFKFLVGGGGKLLR